MEVEYLNDILVYLVTWLFGGLYDMSTRLPVIVSVYRLLLVFIGGRRFRKLFGRDWASLFWKANHSAAEPLRRTTGPVTYVTSYRCFVLHVFRLVNPYNINIYV